MKLVNYLKKNGAKHTISILYKYKLDILLKKILSIVTKYLKLSNTIVIEGHNDFDSNAGAFYDYLIDNHYNDKYKIVWLLKNKRPNNLPSNVKGYYLNKPSIMKNYYLCTAKYILTCNDAIGSIRSNQKSIYLTHGPVSLKSFKGKEDIPSDVNYILMPSEYLEDILRDMHGISNSETPKTKILGYPSHDLLYRDNNELKKITNREFQKVILWMPTFRKLKSSNRNDSSVEQKLGVPIIDDLDTYDKLNEKLREKDALLIIKIHPMQDMSTVKIGDKSNIIVLTGKSVKELDVDNYRLMSNVDALISDYSSAAYDFLHCDKPIGYTMDDLKSYKLGLIVDNPDVLIGGPKIYNIKEFLNFIDSVLDNKDEYKGKRHQIFNNIFKYHDGNSSERLAKFLKLDNSEVNDNVK